MNAVTIRQFRSQDQEELLRIAVLAWKPIFAYYEEALGSQLFAHFFPDWQAQKQQEIASTCQRCPERVFVAVIGNQVVGFVTFFLLEKNTVAEIGNNAVDPQFQNQGIATKMYACVFDRLQEMGVQGVKVKTGADPAHAPARGAYARAGFHKQLPQVELFRQL